MTKIGIFGGQFNPPHNGHIELARQVKKELKLQKMLIIPTKKSPHKKTAEQDAVPFRKRIEMCARAFPEEEGFEVSDIEGKLGSVSYTINTIRALRDIYAADTQFFLLIGGDMLFCFEKWYRYESILKECKVVAAARHDDEYINMLEYATELGHVKVLNLPVMDISSTLVREAVRAGEDISGFVPGGVAEYIKENKFYLGAEQFEKSE